MAAKLRNSCEKCKNRVNICKKKTKDLFKQEKLFIFATSLTEYIMNETSIEKRVVGVDITESKVTYAVVDVRGNILAKDSFPIVDEYSDVNHFIMTLTEKLMEMIMANGGYETIRSVGIGSPSATYMTGNIENAANLRWKGVVPLSALLRDNLGLAVAVGNDCHAAGLAEHVFGCAHGMKDFIVIRLDTGFGSCIFSHGEPHLGAHGFAGEIGHACAIHDGRQCNCGNKGCLEAYTSRRGLQITIREMLEETDVPSLLRGIENPTAVEVTKCCEQGDELAKQVYRRQAEFLAHGLANYASIFDPEAIILTGGVVNAGNWLLEPLVEAFNTHVFPNLIGRTKFMFSFLSDEDRALLGASVLAWDIKEYSLFK